MSDKLDETLQKLVEHVASKDDRYGTWWGHDTDCGTLEEAFAEAKSQIILLISQAMPEENYYHSGWNSAISTMRENLKKVGLL